MRTLIAWSGGYDSTFALYNLLAHTDDEVVAFHMDLGAVQFDEPGVTFSRLSAAEAACIPKLIDWLTKNVRSFEYRDIPVKRMEQQGFISRTMLKTALDIVNTEKFDRFVYSRSEENNLSANRLGWLQRVWTAHTETPMDTPLIDVKQGRPHALATLPKELQALMFSCDDPQTAKDDVHCCAKCVKCKITKLCRDLLKVGDSPDAIFDFYLRRMGVGPYVGALTVDPDLQPKKRQWLTYPEESQ